MRLVPPSGPAASRVRRAAVLVAVGSLVAVSVQHAAPGLADSFASDWADLQAGFEAGGTVTLAADITQNDGENLSVADPTPVTLDLNGHSLSISDVSDGPGIEAGDGSTFTVADSTGGGSLTVTGSEGAAGIGAANESAGTISITGGTVTATGGLAGAGIGGAFGTGGTISVSGGTVTATGGRYGAGIGGGYRAGGAIAVTGGSVTANGGQFGAGIGGGFDGAAGSISISGGTVTAGGGTQGAGIGGGYRGAGGTISVTGGSSTAGGGQFATGIGGGYDGAPGSITVSAGTVAATGGQYGAGIGAGYDGEADGSITISDGTVTATGGQEGAGIGTSYSPSPAGALAITVSGGSVTATGAQYGAGIGGGYNSAGSAVSVTGGSVTATGGDLGAGVGGGYAGDGGSLTVGPEGAVTAANGIGASAVGFGAYDNPATFGSLSNAGLLTVPYGRTLTVPADVSVDNTGLLAVGGVVFGTGTVVNTGRIVTATLGGTVAGNGQGPAGTNLLVSEHNYDLTFDTRGASSETPSDLFVYATTLNASDQSLPAAPTRAGHPFVGWFTAATGGTQVTEESDLTQLVDAPGPTAITLYAQYLPEQIVEFTDLPDHPHVGDTVAVSASGGASGNPVTVSVDANTEGYGTDGQACSLNPTPPPAGAQTLIDFNHVGACVLDADQDEGGNYSAGHAQHALLVEQGTQAITFTSHVPVGAHPGDTYTPTAAGGDSGEPVMFSIADSSTDVCSLDEAGATVTFDHAGTCVVDADQGGSDDYAAAPQVHQEITVGRLAQTITFTSTAPTGARVGDTYTPTATGGDSGEPVTFDIADASASVCSIDGAGTTVTFDHAGTCVVTADQDGSDDYTAAAQQRQNIAVAPAVQPRLFTPLTPQARALDTRSGVGAPAAKVGPGGSIVLTVPFLPAGTRAVVLNLAAVGLSGATTTSVSACPAAVTVDACAATSVLNVSKPAAIANEITVPVSDDGRIRLYNHSGSVNLVGDVIGYLADGYTAAGPARVYDSRAGAPAAPIAADSSRVVTLPNVPEGARAAIVNLTGVGLAGAGSTYLSACSAPVSQTDCARTSVLNVTGPRAIANEVTVPIGSDGTIRLYNRTGRINVAVDVAGYLTSGYSAPTPARILDTRSGVGAPRRQVGPDSAIVLTVPDLPVGATAVTLNVTGAGLAGAASTYVTACRAADSGADCARTSTLNASDDRPIANEVTIPVDADGKIRLYNRSGSINLVVDLVGVYVTLR